MKTHSLLVTLAAFFLCAVGARADEAADKAELLRMEKEFAVLLNRNDVAAIEAALAPEWNMVGAQGAVVDRAKLVEWLKAGKLKLESYAASDYDVRVHGDAAVVTGVDRAKGTWDGESFDLRERFSDFYVRKNGKWVCIWSHSSTLAEEP